MRNSSEWKPSKFILRNGKLRGSRDTAEVSLGSRFFADILAEVLQRILTNHISGRLLDLGCGKVPLFETYRDHVTDVICVDWCHSIHGREYLDCEADLSQDLPFRDAVFDTVLISDVLEHLMYPKQLWREMYRVTATGGRVIVSIPFMYWLHEEPHDFCRYTEHALRRMASEAGFKVVEIKSVGGAFEVIVDILSKSLAQLHWIFTPIVSILQQLSLAVTHSRIGIKIANRTGAKFPLGYSLLAVKTQR